MQDLEHHITRVEHIKARYNSTSFINPISGINNLALQWIFISLIQWKVAGKPITHKGILITENNLNNILIFGQKFLLHRNRMPVKNNISFLHPMPIDYQTQYTCTCIAYEKIRSKTVIFCLGVDYFYDDRTFVSFTFVQV